MFADYFKQDAEKWREYVKNAVDKYNENPISSDQKIISLITPTMKLRVFMRK